MPPMSEKSCEPAMWVQIAGPLKLATPAGDDLTPRGRKARALILYLLLKPDHTETRHTLMTLLWSDRGIEQAQQSLRQTLHELRPLMDRTFPILVADRFTVSVNPTNMVPMAIDPATGVPNIIGANLDGISPAFDQWLCAERRKSYDAIVETAADATGRKIAPPADAATPAALSPRSRSRWRRYAIAPGLLLSIGILAVGLTGSGSHARQRVIVVQPLHAMRGDVAADQLSQDFVSDLSRAALGHDAVIAFADGQLMKRKPPYFNVGGKIATVGGHLHAIIMIGNGDDPAILWSHEYTASLGDLPGLRQQISTNVAAVLICALGMRGVPDRIDDQTTALYLEACNLHSGDQRQVAYLLRQVTARAPLFASGWSDLAVSLAFASDDASGTEASAMRQEATAAARRALSLDPHQGNAYYARALLLPGLRNWVARERIIRAGIDAQPDNPQLYNRLAIDLADIGRVQDSIVADRRAVALDPLFPGKIARLIRALANAGDLDEADDAIRHMRATWPDNGYTWHAAFMTAARIGDPREAEAMLDAPQAEIKGREAAAWRLFLDARAAPTRGHVDRAIAALFKEQRLDAVSDVQLVSDLTLLGHPEMALPIAMRIPAQTDNDFWFRSFLKPVRADPRFMTIANNVGLYDIWRTTGLWPDFCSDRSVPYDCRKAVPSTGAETRPTRI